MARYNIVKNIRKRKIIILVVLLILIMVSWLIWGNLSVETNKLTVTFKDLPEAFDNFSIAHISDLHNAEYGKNNEKLIDILKAESPNIIAMNSTPFVRQYDILSNKWGDFICQRAYRTNGIHRSSRNT